MNPSERLLDRRRSGVLLHPTSLISGEGAHQQGALGAAARAFIDWLAQAGFSVWQVLPLGPPGDGGSPYWARSDFAGDVSLIDRYELAIMYHRVASFANRDQDIAMIGLLAHL